MPGFQKQAKEFLKRLAPSIFGHAHLGRSRMYRHWEAILLASIVLNVGILLFSFYLFLQINEGDIFAVAPKERVTLDTIDRDKLRRTLGELKERETVLERRKTERLSIPNPSF